MKMFTHLISQIFNGWFLVAHHLKTRSAHPWIFKTKKHYPNSTKGKNGISNLPSKTLSMEIALI
jgi:hypothetical protein